VVSDQRNVWSYRKLRPFAHSADTAEHSSIQHIVSDLAPNDFHLFPTLKGFLGGRYFKNNGEVKDAIKRG